MASYGVRRASELVQLIACDAKVDKDAISANVKATKRKNDECWLGHIANSVGIPSLGSACPAMVRQD